MQHIYFHDPCHSVVYGHGGLPLRWTRILFKVIILEFIFYQYNVIICVLLTMYLSMYIDMDGHMELVSKINSMIWL